jgi:aminopeptidase N
MWVNAQDVFSEDESEYRRPIVDKNFVFADDIFDDTTYKKGAWMLHELRYLMGDKAFFSGLKGYLGKFSEKNADTHDFRKSMEEASGLSLEQFFEQSVFLAGFPEFEVSYSWNQESKSAMVGVKQTQDVDLLTPLFVLPCDLVFYTAKGRQKKRIWLRGPQQSFTYELDEEPSIVEFDPEQWLLKKVKFTKGLRLLANQLERSEDASSRAEAARDLGVLKSAQAVEALEKAASRQQFWFVNACALKALGEIGTKDALEAILRAGKPSNRRTRRALAEALANFDDARAGNAVEELLTTDLSPYVRCEAALSIAKQMGRESLPILKEVMKTKSPNEALAEACLEAIGKSNAEEGWETLREYLAYGKPTRARIGALKGIKARGRLIDGEVPILKGILLSDPEFSVRDYVANKLASAVNDPRLLDALKKSSETDRDNRVRRGALKAIHALSNEAEGATTMAALREEVERLKAAVKRLPATG